MKKPLISIIVPIYKTEHTLARCLDSLINQTLRDIEIICVNDGSPDNALAICESYMKRDPRVIVISQENQGRSAARNAGLFQSSGVYIQFCDSDDFYDIHMCEKLYQSMTSSSADLAVVSIKVIYDMVPIVPGDDGYYRVKQSGLFNIGDETIRDIDSSVCNKIFKKSIIDLYNITCPVGLNYEDACFLFKYLIVSKTIFYIQDRLYYYIRCPDSIMSETLYQKTPRAIDHIRIMYDVKQFMDEYKLFNRYTHIYLWMILGYMNLVIWHGTEIAINDAFEITPNLLKEIDDTIIMSYRYGIENDIKKLLALKQGNREKFFSQDLPPKQNFQTRLKTAVKKRLRNHRIIYNTARYFYSALRIIKRLITGRKTH